MITSREGLLVREREIINVLHIFLEKNLDFIVVGGYAISTYQKRFSIDLDVVISEEDLAKFRDVIEKKGYSLNYDKDIKLVYCEKFKRFSKKIKGLNANVDFLINGLVSRTTDCTWSFNYIKKHSSKRKLDNLEFFTPKKELLIAMKFHSGRLSDIRDIVSLMPCNKEDLILHILNGNIKKLRNNIKKLREFLEKPQFEDSFKGIFGIHAFKEDNIRETKKLVKYLLKLK